MKILIIVPFYRFFVKEWVDHISHYVDEVNVIIHHNKIAELARYVPLGGFFDHVRHFTFEKLIDKTNMPPNVYIHILSMTYLVPDNRNKSLPDKIFKLTLKKLGEDITNFDVIHAHFTWPSGVVAYKLKKRFGIPTVITTHALHQSRMKFFEDIKALQVWNGTDAIVNVSKKCCDLLRELGVDETKLWYIPNGVDIKKFSPMDVLKVREYLGIPQDRKILLSVGNLVEKKGFEYGIMAMKKIIESRDDTLWYIVGEGHLRKKLRKLIEKLGVKDYVYLVGFKPHHEIPLWMNATDVFVLPSLVENFGVVNIEAMACGKPVVSTYNGGSEEIITSKDYGFLCPPRDPDCLAEKILMALEREWDGEKIRKYAEQFSWEKISEQLILAYSTVINGGRRR